MSEKPVRPAPRRRLGPLDAGAVVVGAIIGVGIFFTPSSVARAAGSAELTMLAWVVGGAIAMLGALTFAELGALYPRNGGQYQVLRDAYGRAVGFLFVFCNATAIQAGAIGIIAIVCAENLAIAGGAAVPTGATLAGISSVLIVGLVAANVAGVRWGATIQNLTVVSKVLTLLAVAALAIFGAPAPASEGADAAEPAGAVGIVALLFAAMVPAFFSYGGWQHALWIAGEVRRPRRNVPLAIVGGVALVTAVYVLANWAYLRLVGYGGVAGSTTIAADAVGAVWPSLGSRLVAGAVAISAFGVLNAQLLSGPRLIYGMAREARLFGLLGRRNVRLGTPVAAIVSLGALALVLLWVAGRDGVDRLLTGVVFIDGVFFALTGAALIVLRRKRPGATRAVRVVGYPVVPLLFVLGEVGIVAGAYVDPGVRGAAVVGAVWIGVGVLVYAADRYLPAGLRGPDARG